MLLTDCLADLMGGAERQIYELAKALDKDKFNITIASLECVGQAPRHLIEGIGCRFVDFRVKRIYGLSGFIQGSVSGAFCDEKNPYPANLPFQLRYLGSIPRPFGRRKNDHFQPP